MTTITVAPPYSIIFVCDNSAVDVEVPDRVRGELAAANDTCISVGTYPSDDGDTEICLTGSASVEETAGFERIFSGRINSPNRQIDVATAENNVLLSLEITTTAASVSVWVDQLRWPTKILIVASSVN
jgi:hypothetical protein